MGSMSTVRLVSIAALILTVSVSQAVANPVSFKDGYGIMSSYSPDRFDTELNYSFSSRAAFGVSSINLLNYKDETPRFQFAQFNFLVKRWNELESQANFYVSLGAGARELDGDASAAGLIALEGDYETRRVYTSLLSETLQSAGGLDFNRIRSRAGVAPYLAPFESLQTWIIGQVEYTPDVEDTWTVTPLLRFFYNNIALEAGASVDGEVFIGTMLHF